MKALIKRLVEESHIVSSTPVLATFTSFYPNTLRGKFLILRAWQKFTNIMRSKLPYREYGFRPIAWSIESSENTVHIHCVLLQHISLRALTHAWKGINRHDLGKIDIRGFSTFQEAISYTYKDYLEPNRLSRFFGHFAFLKPVPI